MYTKEIEAGKFKEIMKILRTVIGRSEDIFRHVFFINGRAAATDGCLRVFARVGIPGRFVVPSDVIWALAKHSQGKVWISIRGRMVEFRTGGMDLILESQQAAVPRPCKFEKRIGAFGGEFIRAVDFVSRPLEEDDPVELYAQNGKIILLGRSGGISAIYVLEGAEGEWSGSFPYQSTRRLVKAFLKKKSFEVWGGEDLCVKSEDFEMALCREELSSGIRLPDTYGCKLLDKSKLMRLMEKAYDVLGNVDVLVEASSGKLRLYGSKIRVRMKCLSDPSFPQRNSGLLFQ